MTMAHRVPRRRIDGVLLIDKPAGLGSNAVLQHVKRMYHALKAGHTGTLDPLASGLLPICFGEATKFAHGFLDADKTYVATLLLGVTTSTGDAEGEVLERRLVTASLQDVTTALTRFVGILEQTPPRHAAMKYQGRNYYEYARAGIEIPRSPRQVFIEELELEDWRVPYARVRVRCSKGTYVRALAEDIGGALGCGAHLCALRRVAVADLSVMQAHTLETVERFEGEMREALLLPADVLVRRMPALDLPPGAAVKVCQGQRVACATPHHGTYRLYTAGAFIGIGTVVDGILQPKRLSSCASIAKGREVG